MSLVDDDGQVLEERGTDAGPAALVLGWSRQVGTAARARVHDLEDLMITSTIAHHLVRRVPVAGAEPAWVYLRIDRHIGNLALARRQLAGLVLRVHRAESTPSTASPTPPPATTTSPLPALPPLPHRRPGALLPPAPSPDPPPEPPPPEPPPPAPAVPPPRPAGDGADLHVMRRLLAGLRRLV